MLIENLLCTGYWEHDLNKSLQLHMELILEEETGHCIILGGERAVEKQGMGLRKQGEKFREACLGK